MSLDDDRLQQYREQLTCNFQQLDLLFADCMEEAASSLSEAGIRAYLEGASLVCMIGRGFEPVLVYLEEMPQVAARLGEAVLERASQTVWKLSRTPNGAAILPFLQTLPEAARRLGSEEQLEHYIELVMDMMARTSGSIHGGQATIPSPGAIDFLEQMPYLLNQLSLQGIRHWTEYGINNYGNHPERQKDYFSLQSADSRAILQRERHGTLLADHERQLELYLRALWRDRDHLVPYSTAFDELRKPIPYYDSLGIRLPDVFDNSDRGVPGIDRYRAVLAHIAAHRRWSGSIFADNFSPFQRIAIETLEDSRVEYLAMQRYPGLRRLWLSLHPVPLEDECNGETHSCIRHRLAMLSHAILNPDHPYRNPAILETVAAFHTLMKSGGNDTQSIVQMAISFIARTRTQGDQAAHVYFRNTEIDYRDDNRHLWKFIEEGDEEEQFEVQRKAIEQEELNALPPRHYPEWDYKTKTYRPDWVSLYESLHPPGDSQLIDRLLTKHSALAKQLKRVLDLLKPQQYVRVRYQEEGSELDLDVAIRSLVEFKSGANPDPRINMSHRHDGRDIAVMLLLDLSASLHEVPAGCEQSILQLSQEAVALLGWAIDRLGDDFAIAGFSSNTRHEVRYQHIKGYSEQWDEQVKARLAAMEAGYSTRMGAAMRHAGHYLGTRKVEKKLLLILTDGEPSDIDVDDERLLIEDARKAVLELDRDNIYTYCINLDPHADDYVRDIFGNQYSVIDRVEKLPAKLPELFLSLTG
mgnify:CR=1 FL=1